MAVSNFLSNLFNIFLMDNIFKKYFRVIYFCWNTNNFISFNFCKKNYSTLWLKIKIFQFSIFSIFYLTVEIKTTFFSFIFHGKLFYLTGEIKIFFYYFLQKVILLKSWNNNNFISFNFGKKLFHLMGKNQNISIFCI